MFAWFVSAELLVVPLVGYAFFNSSSALLKSIAFAVNARVSFIAGGVGVGSNIYFAYSALKAFAALRILFSRTINEGEAGFGSNSGVSNLSLCTNVS